MKWIFFFNGWGMTEEAFPHLSLDQVEIINYPYDRIETLLKKHENDTLYAVAWSFGAYYFSKLPTEIQNRFRKKIVLNGLPESLGPYGILPKMCKFTLDTLSPESLLAFYKNMDFHGSISKNFTDIREELEFFYKNYQVPANPFDFAWIGEEDRIFSAKKLIRYYEKEKVPYRIFPGGHYPFHYFQNFLELLGDSTDDL
ncbi:DUF452 family protein [Fusobacterium necrophorum]|uniref:DUF452 family protein n=1 Tax=Fusobacterium necrophorum TaxID=859 RepID=A0A4Q2L2C6_9FUSO|nr:DUF452 family protein [Fusobacterium necrophorum]AVQ21906.1 DUF452 domain-containing protein [Fusobacterium necrophorum subsp. funduliforme]MDK4502370.1 DUF452 family protein [Fusobacterium necrophorum]RXZ71619.1 DUF452 family protein [Fusobacterium necrophorum]